MLGWQQEAWLDQGFSQSKAQWNVIAQDLLVAPLLQRDLTQHTLGHWTDGWDGYMNHEQSVHKSERIDQSVQMQVAVLVHSIA